MKYNRDDLIATAVAVNEGYRIGDSRKLEIGFLYGTAEMIVSLTLADNESYGELREELARKIDKEAAKLTYPLLPSNGYEKKS